jgi:dynein heavy chain
LSEFIKVTSQGLGVEVQEGDYDGLVEVMVHLVAIKDRQPNTDNMFEPLKRTIDLLCAYNQEMSDDVHQLLEVWDGERKGSRLHACRVSRGIGECACRD